MVDGIDITPGSGSSVDTDQLPSRGGRHAQVVKIAHGDDGTGDFASPGTGFPVQATGASGVAVASTGAVGSAAVPAFATLASAKASRRGLQVFNDSTGYMFLKYGDPPATPTVYTVKIGPGALWEMPQPIYTGPITGTWTLINGRAQVTET